MNSENTRIHPLQPQDPLPTVYSGYAATFPCRGGHKVQDSDPESVDWRGQSEMRRLLRGRSIKDTIHVPGHVEVLTEKVEM